MRKVVKMKLKVIDKISGKVWIEENKPHSWEELCLFIMDRHEYFKLIYCDIEAIVKHENHWLMLDECGSYEFIPDEFIVEAVSDS